MSNPTSPDLAAPASVQPRRDGVWQQLLSRPLALIGLFFIAITLLGALFAPWLTGFDPNDQMFDGLTIEGAPLPPDGKFWLGTDLLGRDLLTRILYGARTSLIIGIAANGTALLIGTLVGVTAGAVEESVDTLAGLFGDKERRDIKRRMAAALVAAVHLETDGTPTRLERASLVRLANAWPMTVSDPTL